MSQWYGFSHGSSRTQGMSPIRHPAEETEREIQLARDFGVPVMRLPPGDDSDLAVLRFMLESAATMPIGPSFRAAPLQHAQ
jgi:hypothetical protein